MSVPFILYEKASGKIVNIGAVPERDLGLQVTEGLALMRIRSWHGLARNTHRVVVPAPDTCGCSGACGDACHTLEKTEES